MKATSFRVGLRHFSLLAAACWVLVAGSASGQPPLVSNEVATPLGLERAWFAQIQVDNSRHAVKEWTLFEDNLLVQTSGGVVHSLNVETGETMWVVQAAPPDRSFTGPAANKDYVSVVCGATLSILNRADGRLMWRRDLGGAPAAAPALTERHAYVSFLSGRIEAYQLDDPRANVWYYQSIGRIFHSPYTSGSTISWPSNRGYLYVGSAATTKVMFRIHTDSPAVAPPTEPGSLLFFTTSDGHIYCSHHKTGQEVWKFAMGFAATGRAAAIGDRLYVASKEPMLYSLDAKTGQLVWNTPGVTQFVAQGGKKVYGLDDMGRLLMFDRQSGKYLGMLPGEGYQAVFNEQSDRVLLIDQSGLVQCLREAGAVEPTMYRQLAAEEAEKPAEEASPFATEPPVTQPAPTTEPAAEDTEASPFSAEPSEEPADAANPFSFGE
jgi:outer membrane protein assembly factor BamB